MDKDPVVTRVFYSSDELAEHFINAFAHVLKNTSDQERPIVYKYTLDLVGTLNLYARLSPDSFAAMLSEIYATKEIRDFISTVQSVFIGRWLQGRGKDLLYSLVEDLALSLSYDLDLGLNDSSTDATELVKLCAIPPPVREDLITTTDVMWLIQANPILISVILINQYINLSSFSADSDSK